MGGRADDPLVCPACGASGAPDERFCSACGMPLVSTAEPSPVSERHERARKIHGSFAEGPLVKVGWAHNQAEAELIAGMLLEEGIPSVIRRAAGFDVPDFLAAGPRDVLVAESGAERARELLHATGAPAARATTAPGVRGAALALLAIATVSVLIGLALSLFF